MNWKVIIFTIVWKICCNASQEIPSDHTPCPFGSNISEILVVEHECYIKLSRKRDMKLLIKPANAKEVEVAIIDFDWSLQSGISFLTFPIEVSGRYYNSSQHFINSTLLKSNSLIKIVAAKVKIKDIQMKATLKITPVNRAEDDTWTVIEFPKQPNDLIAFPKHLEESHHIEDLSNTSNLIFQKSLILGVLGTIAIVLTICLLKVGLKSQNNIAQVETIPEDSSSHHHQGFFVPNIPRSLPSYSECEFKHDFHSNLNSTNLEPPTYEEAQKLN